MSQESIGNKRKKKIIPISEQDCMMRFYEPISKKQNILEKWRKKPER
jgi:hypothetical protein